MGYIDEINVGGIDSEVRDTGTRKTIAPTETTPYASKAYAKDAFFIWDYTDGKVYQATAAIAKDAQFVVGTNIKLIGDMGDAINQAVTDEASARASAINTEASNRAAADSALGTRIDQIVAPTGEAPNPAEITDARIGFDSTVYDNLGNAIRDQIGDLNDFLKDSFQYIDYIDKERTSDGEFKKIYLEPNTRYIVYMYDVIGKVTLYDIKNDSSFVNLIELNSTTGGNSTIAPITTDSNHAYLRLYGRLVGGSETKVKCIIMATMPNDKTLYRQFLRSTNITLDHANVAEYGFNDLVTMPSNYIYKLSSNITENDIANLPIYRHFATLVVLSSNYIRSQVNFKMYIYVDNEMNAYIGFGGESGGTSYIKWVEISNSPISVYDSSFTNEIATFRKITCIGDSLMSGYYKESSSGDQHSRNLEYSWPAILGRQNGILIQHASKSGATTKSWWTDADCKPLVTDETKSQLYIMGIGGNDYKDIPDEDITSAEIGSINSVDFTDYNNNLDDFWGNYCKIIQYVHSIAPLAQIICLTVPSPPRPTRGEWKNEAIREICELSQFSDFISLCDLMVDYKDIVDCESITAHVWQAHYTPIGYANSAKALAYCISKTIRANKTKFITLPQIPYDETIVPS